VIALREPVNFTDDFVGFHEMSILFKNSDRLLLIAPHPDDESLAMGGIIQRALKAGAAVRVLFATNGDRNPWPQRWLEKRWRIGHDESQRWGAMRCREARAALKELGFHTEAHFLNFPDQGVTRLLLRADSEIIERLCRELDEWQPTLLVLPSAYDLHPDHNALFVLSQIALDRLGRRDLPQLQYLVHSRRPGLVPRRVDLQLTDHEVRAKRQAILCHGTQMLLSQKRFIAYARPVELFFKPAYELLVVNGHRIRDAFVYAGALNLTVTLPAMRWNKSSLLIVAESVVQGSLRWRLPLPAASGKIRLRDAVTGEPLRYATVRIHGKFAVVKIPIAAFLPFSCAFVKLKRSTVFLDDSGWREVPLPSPRKSGRLKNVDLQLRVP
jgi:LmbE family N-acetylglucosaminyl deacetylase